MIDDLELALKSLLLAALPGLLLSFFNRLGIPFALLLLLPSSAVDAVAYLLVYKYVIIFAVGTITLKLSD